MATTAVCRRTFQNAYAPNPPPPPVPVVAASVARVGLTIVLTLTPSAPLVATLVWVSTGRPTVPTTAMATFSGSSPVTLVWTPTPDGDESYCTFVASPPVPAGSCTVTPSTVQIVYYPPGVLTVSAIAQGDSDDIGVSLASAWGWRGTVHGIPAPSEGNPPFDLTLVDTTGDSIVWSPETNGPVTVPCGVTAGLVTSLTGSPVVVDFYRRPLLHIEALAPVVEGGNAVAFLLSLLSAPSADTTIRVTPDGCGLGPADAELYHFPGPGPNPTTVVFQLHEYSPPGPLVATATWEAGPFVGNSPQIATSTYVESVITAVVAATYEGPTVPITVIANPGYTGIVSVTSYLLADPGITYDTVQFTFESFATTPNETGVVIGAGTDTEETAIGFVVAYVSGDTPMAAGVNPTCNFTYAGGGGGAILTPSCPYTTVRSEDVPITVTADVPFTGTLSVTPLIDGVPAGPSAPFTFDESTTPVFPLSGWQNIFCSSDTGINPVTFTVTILTGSGVAGLPASVDFSYYTPEVLAPYFWFDADTVVASGGTISDWRTRVGSAYSPAPSVVPGEFNGVYTPNNLAYGRGTVTPSKMIWGGVATGGQQNWSFACVLKSYVAGNKGPGAYIVKASDLASGVAAPSGNWIGSNGDFDPDRLYCAGKQMTSAINCTAPNTVPLGPCLLTARMFQMNPYRQVIDLCTSTSTTTTPGNVAASTLNAAGTYQFGLGSDNAGNYNTSVIAAVLYFNYELSASQRDELLVWAISRYGI